MDRLIMATLQLAMALGALAAAIAALASLGNRFMDIYREATV